MIIDHRTRPRRRGQALQDAILDAALTELAEVGYANLTMERVAARAKASKASVYSRWPSRIELVMDVFYHLMPDPAVPADTGTLRGDLLAAFRGAPRTAWGRTAGSRAYRRDAAPLTSAWPSYVGSDCRPSYGTRRDQCCCGDAPAA